jgi:hypothetical protein
MIPVRVKTCQNHPDKNSARVAPGPALHGLIVAAKSNFTTRRPSCNAAIDMWKKALPVLLLPWLLTGCTATLTNLSAKHQSRNPNNFYPVEVALNSRQQSLRWDSIQPFVIVGTESYPMRPTPLMTNRWEGLIPVPPQTNMVYYHYKFDFKYDSFSGPRNDSATSQEYKLQILEK